MDLNELTIKEFHKGLEGKKFSAREVTAAFLKAIKEKDGELNAYLSVFESQALEAAAAVDKKIASGGVVPALAGVPLAVKDNMLIEGTKTTAASKILENYVASYDATVIGKLKKEDAVFLGKTNLDEFAMGSSTEYSAFKKTKNPHDLTRVPVDLPAVRPRQSRLLWRWQPWGAIRAVPYVFRPRSAALWDFAHRTARYRAPDS